MSLPALRFKDDDGQEFPAFEINILAEVSDVRDGTHDSPKYHPQGYPLITSKNLLEIGEIDLENVNLISNADFNSINKRSKVDIGDILFGMIGTIGNPVMVKSASFAIKNVALIKQKKKLQNIFLVQYLKSHALLKQFDNVTVGNTQKFIALGKLRQLQIQIPCLSEQTKIANFLTAVDEKISLLTQKHDLLTQYKKGVMQQIFSQVLRFKDDNGQDFPDWEEHELDEIFKVTRGNVLSMTLVSQNKSEDNAYPVYSSQTKNNGLSGYFHDYLYENSITWTTDGANAGDVNYRQGKFYCTNVCGVLISNEGHANACVAELINAVSKKYVSYVGNPKLMNNVMAKIKISFPSVIEQTKIANFLTAIDDKITITQNELKAVKQYKQGLLQQMFV